ncbi:hypothetical protein [Paenibacillus sp. HB172176]|uniref:hypothetical protein n=1 Tax=Paenibacillus sp. HB172176 TaxID=2493690 RepID=UPI001439D864|nr:hypothetical protein [Paenibacillus sp. HB172176]
MEQHRDEVVEQVERLLQKLKPEERRRILLQLLQHQGLDPDAFAVGSNYDFWFNGEDDVYDRL